MKIISSIILLTLFNYTSVPKSPKSIFNECPVLTVACPDVIDELKVPATFSAIISGNEPKTNYIYHWTISAGTIITGQNTSKIAVNRLGLEGRAITATVEVGGLPQGCLSKASCTTTLAIVDYYRLFDMYGDMSWAKERARLNNYAIQLKNEPMAVAHIIVYAGKRAYIGEAKMRAERIRNYLTRKQGIKPERAKITDGGYREDATVELWLAPVGIEGPTASPTVDADQVQIIPNNGKTRKRKMRGNL